MTLAHRGGADAGAKEEGVEAALPADLIGVLSRATAALNSPGEVIGDDPSPRYELFHAAASICSQKVRCVLAQQQASYVSHLLDLFLGQTYLPDYVRLRMRGCDALGGALAAYHGGSTSTERGGCDGAVVPTLVDRRSGEVLVDSKRICLRIDAQVPEARQLRPVGLAAAIDEQLTIVDDLPNYQMLMGRKPRDTERHESRSDTLAAFSLRKVAWCDRLLDEHAGDEALTRAYAAKRAKEASAAAELFSPEAMRDAQERAEASLYGLEQTLARHGGAWLFGDRLTLADLFWGIELIRMDDVGVALLKSDRLPGVKRFSATLKTLDSIQQSVLNHPSARF